MRLRIGGGSLATLAALGIGLAGGSALAAPRTATFNLTAVNSTPNGQVTITSKVWITPTQARADVKHPLQGSATMLITDQFFYQLDQQGKRGVKGPLPDEWKKSKDNFAGLFAMLAFDAGGAVAKSKRVRTEKVAGYTCDVFTNTMKNGDATRSITVWLPQKMDPKFPVKAIKSDKISKPGASLSETVTITLSNIRVNGSIPASVFKVPAGYQIKTLTAAPKPPGAGGK
jgi:outer membrane lipoprotein-sorting protein